MSYYIDPNATSKVSSAIQTSPEYQQWLKKTFPLPSWNASDEDVTRSTTATFQQNPQQQQTSSSTALMIIQQNSDQSDRNNNNASNNMKNYDLKSLQQQSSNVIINTGAIDANEHMKNSSSSSNKNESNHNNNNRAVTLEDFNTAFYRKKEGLMKKLAAGKNNNNNKNNQETSSSLPPSTLPQRRSEREEEEPDTTNNKPETSSATTSNQQEQEQEKNSNNSNENTNNNNGSAIFALPDHLGRTFLHCPQPISSGEIKRNDFSAQKLPQKLSHAYKTAPAGGGAAAAITTLTWVPPHGHLAMIGDIMGTCSIFEVLPSSGNSDSKNPGVPRTEKLAVYTGHHQSAIRDISFPAGDARRASSTVSGTLPGAAASNEKFLTCSTDAAHPLALWDTERAQVVSSYKLSESWTNYSKFIREAGCSAVAFAPPGIHAGATRGDSLFVSSFGKTIIVWDTRSATRVVDLEAHHGNVHHLKFVQYGRGLFSAGDDKTLRLWDLRSTAAVQEFSHAQMHSISNVIEHPWTGDVFAQSNDDRVRCLMRTGPASVSSPSSFVGRLMPQTGQYVFGKEEKDFKGHSIAGTGCKLGLSRTDGGSVVSSGDVFGNLYMWQYNNNNNQQNSSSNNTSNADPKLLRKFRASAKELTVHDWHPIVPGLILTGGRDGLLKCFR